MLLRRRLFFVWGGRTGGRRTARGNSGPGHSPPTLVAPPDTENRLRLGHQLNAKQLYVGKEHRCQGKGKYGNLE